MRARAQLIAGRVPARSRSCATTTPSLPEFDGDREQLIQALLNVVRNAAQALRRRRRPRRSSAHARRAPVTLGARAPPAGTVSCMSRTTARVFPTSSRTASSIRWCRAARAARGLGLTLAQDFVSSSTAGASSATSDPGRTVFSRSVLPRRAYDERTRHHDQPSNAGLKPSGSSTTTARSAGCSRRRCARGHCRASRSTRRRKCCTRSSATSPQVLVSDIRMPGRSGLELLEQGQASASRIAGDHHDRVLGSRQRRGRLPGRRVRVPAQAVRRRPGGRADPPRAAARRRARAGGATTRVPQRREILGQAPAMQEVFRAIGRLSQSSVTVLITGESGTGKELVARALHDTARRAPTAVRRAQHRGDPARSARVRAVRPRDAARSPARRARAAAASSRPTAARCSSTRSATCRSTCRRACCACWPTASSTASAATRRSAVDVRVIAATHQDLEAARAPGPVPRGPVHRLNVIRLRAAAAARAARRHPRAARGSISSKRRNELGVAPKTLTDGRVEALTAFDWPGNVRELENVCRWLTVMAPAARSSGRICRPSSAASAISPAPTGRRGLSQWAEAQLAIAEPPPL